MENKTEKIKVIDGRKSIKPYEFIRWNSDDIQKNKWKNTLKLMKSNENNIPS